jgi:membrane-bound serine protease (ClpP class)
MFAYFRAPVGWMELLRRTVADTIDDGCPGLAAELAFYYLLALFPTLLFLVSLLAYVDAGPVLAQSVTELEALLPAAALTIVRDAIDEVLAGGHGGIMTAAIAGAIWSSSSAVTAIITALNRAYDIVEWRPWWQRRLLAIALTIGLALFVVAAFALVVAGGAIGEAAAGRIGAGQLFAHAWPGLRWLSALVLVVVAVDLVYYFAPNAEAKWVWVTPGALLATALWLLASYAFKLYVQNFDAYTAAHGAIGAVIVLMLWFYLSGLALLVGAELNAEIDKALPRRDTQPPRPGRKKKIGPAAAAALALLVPAPAAAQAPDAQPAVALVAEYDGIIHPIAAEFFGDVLTRADAIDARVAIFVLRTPGGLLDSTRSIVSRMIAAPTPVIVYVAPGGARAASAGFIITLAADVAAMAPGTHIGAAHPVPAGGGQASPDKTLSDKAASDTAAYARTLAETRRRNVTLAADAVLESRAFTDQEALTATPPLVDLVVPTLDDLVARLDGRRIRRFDGRETVLATTGVRIERMAMTRRQQLLSAIAHPQIAYLLLTLGMLGLVVELWNPGAIAPAVIGGICLLLAFFAFQVLPVNTTGVLLILLGVALLLVEVKVPSFGVLGVGGIVALAAGSVMVTSEVPGIAVDYRLLLPVVAAFGAVVLALGRLAVQAQRLASVTGVEGMIGEAGRALTAIVPGTPGQIRVHGEIWRAMSDETIAAGAAVRVVAVRGLTAIVETAGPSKENST